MAHQTPQYPASQDPEHLDDTIMIEFPFCGLFSSSKRNDDHDKGDDVMDAIKFPPTIAGTRKQRSMEEMQGIIDHLNTVLDDLSQIDNFREQAEDLRETPLDMDMTDTERDNMRLQDAVKLSTLLITYWEEEWTPENSQAEHDRPVMEKAAQLIGDLMEGVQDQAVETWDDVGKVSLQRARLWLQCGGLDKNAPHRECYETEIPNQDGAGDEESRDNLGSQQNRFQCNQCPEAFDRAVNLEDHLRQNHGGRGVGKWLGRTLRQRVFWSLARGVRIKGKVENKQGGREGDSGTGDMSTEPTSSAQLDESWQDVTPLPAPLLQPVQCPTCFNTYTSLTALRNHQQAEHNNGTDVKGVVSPTIVDPPASRTERRIDQEGPGNGDVAE